ncbi:MAG TPA: hypothetical protein DEP36_17500, partial [Gammaproteobacteria bacterium]|nr:hypothetical protein [Gammaproteobacteria bacterium]
SLRSAPFPSSPGYRLIDAQFHWLDQQAPRLCSGMIGPKGVLLLNGKSDILHTINPHLLSFNATHAEESYLGFFCAFVRGDEGPFQVISEVGEIPVGDSLEKSLLNRLRESIAPMQYLDGSFEKDGWQRYEATILYSNAVFKTTLKLMPSGMVDMESDEPIAVELPILRRQYDGPLRTPPQ